MLYSKILHGWVEALYDLDGNCLALKFVQNESEPVERRARREASDGPQQPDELEEDELIEEPSTLEEIEGLEKFVDIKMVQPPQP